MNWGIRGSYPGSFQQLLNGREKTDSKQVIGTDSRNTSDDHVEAIISLIPFRLIIFIVEIFNAIDMELQ